jgi:ADP-heptose:LPS heptosyltransferase
MGVTLGDSVIGMNAIAWLKARHPALRIHLYRTPHAPPFVERLYALACPLIEHVHYLPRSLASLPDDLIDLSDILHWPAFATEPMVDFFLRGLGIAPDAVPATAKANRWLSCLKTPPLAAPWASQGYALFSGQASTPLRTVPAEHACRLVDRIHRSYGLPVLGFGPVEHPRYHDVSALSTDLDHYIAWVRGARVVIGTDSSAIHLAAGFDVPTLAFFVSIDPQLRVRDYPHCRSIDARSELTRGLHQSDDPIVLQEASQIWQALAERTALPWPEPARRSE